MFVLWWLRSAAPGIKPFGLHEQAFYGAVNTGLSVKTEEERTIDPSEGMPLYAGRFFSSPVGLAVGVVVSSIRRAFHMSSLQSASRGSVLPRAGRSPDRRLREFNHCIVSHVVSRTAPLRCPSCPLAQWPTDGQPAAGR